MYVLAPSQTIERFPYSIDDLKRDNPNTSFPRNLSDELLADYNVYPVEPVTAPEYDYGTQNCNQVNPTLQDGEWVATYEVTDASEEEKTERLEIASTSVREERNRRLAVCDWTQLTDQPLSESDQNAWRVYRQNLRDIPKQSGFPWNITWPETPSS